MMADNCVKLILYVQAKDGLVKQLEPRLRKMLVSYFDDKSSLQVVYVDENPGVATKHKIISLPTLAKVSPPPVKHYVGDLSDIEELSEVLGKSVFHR